MDFAAPSSPTARSCSSPALSTSSDDSSSSAYSSSSSTDGGGARAAVIPSRKRMRQFLEELLETKAVDGLEWCDRDERVFRLPWKHAKRTNYDAEKDGKLFKLWAINTGKYREGADDKSDLTNWKINFRCALNCLRESITELDAPNDDYRVFRFDEKHTAASAARKLSGMDLGGASVQERLPPADEYLPPYMLVKRAFPWGYEADLEFEQSPASANDYGDYGHPPAKMPYLADPRFAVPGFPTTNAADLLTFAGNLTQGGNAVASEAIGVSSQDFTEAPSPPVSKGTTSRITEIVDIDNGSGEFDQSQSFSSDDIAKTRGQAMVAAPPHPALAATNTGSKRPLVSTEMFVKVSYRSSPVAGIRVAQGCRIFYGAPPPPGMPPATQESLFGPRTLMQLSLPHPNEAQALLPAMWEVLNAMHRGLVIEMRNNDIYATRLCRAAIYWGPPGHDGLINKLERCKRTRIFSYQSFLQTYDSYQHPQRVNIACYPPAYEVVLGVAQPWGRDRLRDNNLLTVTLVHSLGEKLIESLHRQRWNQKSPFDSDYIDIDSETADDELASNARHHMVKAGRQGGGASQRGREEVAPASGAIQHPALAAMSTPQTQAASTQSGHQGQQTQAQAATVAQQRQPSPQVQPAQQHQLHHHHQQQQQQVAAAMMQTSMVNAAAAASHLQTLQRL